MQYSFKFMLDDCLTTRQKEVAHLVLQGKSNKQIGRMLDISHLTVKMHVKEVYIRLNVTTRYELIARYL